MRRRSRPRAGGSRARSLEEALERNLRLEACERRADADVRSGAEAKVLLIRPTNVEKVRVGPPSRVAVRCREQDPDGLAVPQQRLGELGVPRHNLRGGLCRPRPAQDLLDCVRDQGWGFCEHAPLIRMLLQRDQALAHQLRRGLASGEAVALRVLHALVPARNDPGTDGSVPRNSSGRPDSLVDGNGSATTAGSENSAMSSRAAVPSIAAGSLQFTEPSSAKDVAALSAHRELTTRM